MPISPRIVGLYMPTPLILRAQLIEKSFYHLIFKSTDGILLFNEDHDFIIFKERIKEYICPVAEIWTYCLLANHVHMIIKIRESYQILESLSQIEPGKLKKAQQEFMQNSIQPFALQAYILRQINSLLTSYSMGYNKRYSRKGGLFQKPFKRLEIENAEYLSTAIIYIHTNPVKHKIPHLFDNYLHSSYTSILKGFDTVINSKSVLDFFGGAEVFKKLHEEKRTLIQSLEE